MRMTHWALTAVLMSALFACDSELFTTQLDQVNEANEALTEGRSGEALELYRRGASTDLSQEESKRLRYDLGLAYISEGQLRCAIREIAAAMGSEDEVLTQKAYAALGTAQATIAESFEKDKEGATAAWQKCQDCDVETKPNECDVEAPKETLEYWKNAVRNYEQALLRDPSDQATLRNLEIALGYTDPSCTKRDKAFEPNNSLDAAQEVNFDTPAPEAEESVDETLPEQTDALTESSWKQDLLSCPNDPDIYRISLEAGDRLSATLKPGAGEGRIALILMDAEGRLLGKEEGIANSEEHPDAPKTATLKDEVRKNVDRLIRVSNMDEEEVTYELEIKRSPACSKLDKEFEPNNSFETAAALSFKEEAPEAGAPQAPSGPQDELKLRRALRLCPDDKDFFSIELDGGDRLSASLKALDSESKAHIALFNVDGSERFRPPSESTDTLRELEFTRDETGSKTVTLAILNPGNEETNYDLDMILRPACHKTDIQFEPNDSPAQAHDLSEAKSVEKKKLSQLKICPANDDYFATTLLDGESIFAFVSPSQNAGSTTKDSQDQETKGKTPSLNLEITDELGNVLRRGGVSGEGRVATLLDPGAGRYLIRVSGAEDHEGRYDLIVETIPACPEGNDIYDRDGKNNNTPLEATLLAPPAPQQPGGPGAGPGAPPQGEPPSAPAYTQPLLARVCAGDLDYYRIPIQGEDPVVITSSFDHEKGDIDMVLLDAAGQEEKARADASNKDANGEALSVKPEEEPTEVVIRLEAKKDADNFYLLRIQNPQPNEDNQDQKENDEKKEDEKKDEKKDDKKDDKKEQKPEPKKSEPFKDLLKRMDRNDKNLEAERARQKLDRLKGKAFEDAGLEDY